MDFVRKSRQTHQLGRMHHRAPHVQKSAVQSPSGLQFSQ